MSNVRDLVYQVSTSTGTGNFTLTTVTGKNTFSSFGTTSANPFYYFISSRDLNEWEVGIGYLLDSATLVRNTIVASSNANARVSFGVGTKDVTSDIPAQYQVKGPSTAPTDNHAVLFDGTTGSLIKSAGIALGTIAQYNSPLLPPNGGTGLSTITANKALTSTDGTNLTWGTLPVSGGGTGVTSLTSNALLLGGSSVGTVSAGTNGQFLKLVSSIPTWATLSGGFTVALKAYTSSQTYTAPAGLIGAIIICTGGGGGGGGVGGATTTFKVHGAGGGGAGGTAIGFLSGTTIGASQIMTIGSGGSGGSGSSTAASAGSNGNTSSFGSLLVASAGSGGSAIYSSSGWDAKNGGAGGAGSTGTLLLTGGSGGSGYTVYSAAASETPRALGGEGGASFWGGGAPQKVIAGNATTAGTSSGDTGAGYGSGGGGAAMVTATATGASGGAGRTGIITIFEFVAA